jgi:hypothetical protein
MDDKAKQRETTLALVDRRLAWIVNEDLPVISERIEPGFASTTIRTPFAVAEQQVGSALASAGPDWMNI